MKVQASRRRWLLSGIVAAGMVGCGLGPHRSPVAGDWPTKCERAAAGSRPPVWGERLVRAWPAAPRPMPWMDEVAQVDGAQLELRGIQVGADAGALVYGSLRIAAGSLRSVLLRWNEVSMAWDEVLEPQVGSEVISLSVAPAGRGWLIVLWTVEGPGQAAVFETEDGGRSWRRRFSWQHGGDLSYPVRFHPDEASLDVTDLPNDRCCTFRTPDQGGTWLPSGSCGDAARCALAEPTSATGADDARWELASCEAAYEIWRRDRGASEERRIAALPRLWLLTAADGER